jgi:FkbM family methyltransferase
MDFGFEQCRSNVTLPARFTEYLHELKDGGFVPNVIYDIGSCVCHFADVARKVWPEARICLFDALPEVERYYVESGYTEYHIGVLTDVDGRELEFYKSDVHPTGSSYYREIGCPGSHVYFNENNCVKCVGSTLDTVVAQRGFPPPDLIKIDVQGCETDIIRGGSRTINAASMLIVEMQHKQYNDGAPLVHETFPLIESLGFRCVAPRFCSNPCDADYAFVRVAPDVQVSQQSAAVAEPSTGDKDDGVSTGPAIRDAHDGV